MCNAVAYCGSRSKGKVDDTEGNAKHLACFRTYKLSHTGDFECGFLYYVCNFVNGSVGHFCNCRPYNAGAAYAYVYNAVRLSYAVECASHKGVILYCITENNNFCCSEAVVISSSFACLTDNSSHKGNSVHIYTCSCRADVYGGAYLCGFSKRLGDRVDKL